ncbi:hypothetical protein A3G06_00015 [Candidatus Nomurabacteria bacterium RIFCSPLOWO2_12_FULL_46_14]|uniref:isoleucine--tRNA ligase n=1 Tax=Candidatus Nomurabacteria bacterium RIFCSPLOWO2_12_FULL_46_14 TaxID=1801797 RepID=A0A1F6YCC6_9BACT|nr:MAG: hypothetical protein A3G06_00015 [Candidatus Nomurabacteria bacterium RIFCSPLOWO2_12_FULL_46_14]
MFPNEGNKKSEVALREEKILKFWRENKVFEKSLAKKSPRGHYVFYDGPPFATGLMHYGHILGSTAKDVIGRFKTMQGFHVSRKWGWDCHGLPIENIVEKDLGVAGHQEIEALGIDKFVEYARSKVLTYDKEWKKSVERIGRWVDFEGGYKTMDNTFIESVWWALGEMNKKGLIYEGVKVLYYCARCETPIANSEIAMDDSYRDIPDISVYVKFELVDEPNTYLLAWTTTPWTLPGNTAIAVNKDVEYVKIFHQGANYVLARDTLPRIVKDFKGDFLESFKGSKLVGKKYKPIFSYYEKMDMLNKDNIYKVWHADFVNTEMGTGLAHEAPAFGEDDMSLAKEHNIPWIIHVDEAGRFKREVADFAGLKVKPKDTIEDPDAHLRTDIEVIKYLQKTGAYFNKEKIVHSYPHCMRCDTPIIYYALPSYFINIQKVKKKIIKSAKDVTWVPAHLKEGRFKNIVENAPDWNISRNRYWASPLPIWKCDKCKKEKFISSLKELKENTVKSGNKYFVMRHGGAEQNVGDLINSDPKNIFHLTAEGRKQVETAAQTLKEKKIGLIISSPFARCQETAEIVRKIIGLPANILMIDEKLGEFKKGPDFEGRPWAEYWKLFKNTRERFDKSPDGGENLLDLKKRLGDFLYDAEKKYESRNILFISHEGPITAMQMVAEGADLERSIQIKEDKTYQSGFAEFKELNFIPLSHNVRYELDFHRPYIDEIKLKCDCGSEMKRVLEVLDGWFESGSMPFAEDHYPFDNPKWQKNNFPAGFVAEYIAQTRTWFYYTHAVSTILFGRAPFKNVVTTGTLRAEDGQKMSKSKNNYPDPQIIFDKYGVDPLRLYLMMSPLMKGEDANFSEKLVQEIASKIIGRLFNVLSFYELYRDVGLESKASQAYSNAILDRWVLSRLNQVLLEVTAGMEAYDMALATRPIESLVEDLSIWYLRRSRERIKAGDKEARQTLYFVLKTIAKLLAPFAPFIAEDIWLRLRSEGDEMSVHLAMWPKAGKIHSDILENMRITREVVSKGLEARQKAQIPVRQPLASLKLKVESKKLSSEYVNLIKDELNVKEIIFDNSIPDEVELDTEITPELKQEGNYRELSRAIQDLRKKMGLTPHDIVRLSIETSGAGRDLVQKFESELKKTTLAETIELRETDGEEIKIEDLVFKIKLLR